MEVKIKRTGGSQFIGTDGLTHYQRNKAVYLAKNARRRKENQEYINKIKSQSNCADCGLPYPHYVMDFDHLPNVGKVANLSSPQAQSWSKAKIDIEIAKCEVVCANCHRIRTAKRAGIV